MIYQAPILYQGFGDANGNLAGLIFVSTNAQNVLTISITSNGFTSCFSGGLTPMDYTVSCLDCLNPGATFTVVPDCPHREYSILVNVTGTGNATDVDIVNSLNTDTLRERADGFLHHRAFR